jgi:ankyrin repeat protein
LYYQYARYTFIFPILTLINRNHPKVLLLLLQNGASSNEINGNKRTPLHLAAINGHVDCVRMLLLDLECDLELEVIISVFDRTHSSKFNDFYLQDFDRKTDFRLAVESSVQSVELFNLFHATGKWNNTFAERWFLHFATENNNFG